MVTVANANYRLDGEEEGIDEGEYDIVYMSQNVGNTGQLQNKNVEEGGGGGGGLGGRVGGGRISGSRIITEV